MFDLYARGLTLRDADPGEFAERTKGASPAYVKWYGDNNRYSFYLTLHLKHWHIVFSFAGSSP